MNKPLGGITAAPYLGTLYTRHQGHVHHMIAHAHVSNPKPDIVKYPNGALFPQRVRGAFKDNSLNWNALEMTIKESSHGTDDRRHAGQ
jgi:hypothetical protein